MSGLVPIRTEPRELRCGVAPVALFVVDIAVQASGKFFRKFSLASK